jgi:hypothetical protein
MMRFAGIASLIIQAKISRQACATLAGFSADTLAYVTELNIVSFSRFHPTDSYRIMPPLGLIVWPTR